eukprot:gb/GFBE01071413.1/.p1 GENE.gb/GFBE01071413.1/~~gb/GFBE01071413.1/.p1  ORF type:complete len:581 (+),score=113.57 gb/GFBE01071413.1/:1-1743(+)
MGSTNDIWLWETLDGQPFVHPAELPNDDEASAKTRCLDKVCGPRSHKITPVKQIDKKGKITMIARPDGSNHEVPTSRTLHWYEGLLLLQELSAQTPPVSWLTSELVSLLDREGAKYNVRSWIYTDKVLKTTAVTGARYFDSDGKEHQFRRHHTKPDDKAKLDEDETTLPKGFWKILDVTGYMPPWEAFCHERCGFYQDFYQVKWDRPFAELDYARVENGCHDVLGTTWEPDECLPPQLDVLRVREKTVWSKKKQEQDKHKTTEAAKRRRDEGTPLSGTPSPPQAEVQRPPKKARLRRDGQPLLRDMFRLSYGHDFDPAEMNGQTGLIRSGWPRRASEYPKGYGAADPPGYCFSNCDCMDDARCQQPWELKKTWLDDHARDAAADSAIRHVMASFKRRGTVTGEHRIEPHADTNMGDTTQAKAALDLARIIEQQVQGTLKDVPLSAISDPSEPVNIPARAFLRPSEDYEPLSYELSPENAAHSAWLKIGSEDGQLLAIATDPPARPIQLKVELKHSGGMGGIANICVTDASPQAGWVTATARIASHFNDTHKHPLTHYSRIALQEQLSKVFDFEASKPHGV